MWKDYYNECIKHLFGIDFNDDIFLYIWPWPIVYFENKYFPLEKINKETWWDYTTFVFQNTKYYIHFPDVKKKVKVLYFMVKWQYRCEIPLDEADKFKKFLQTWEVWDVPKWSLRDVYKITMWDYKELLKEAEEEKKIYWDISSSKKEWLKNNELLKKYIEENEK